MRLKMVTWKLSRILSGIEEFTFSEGDKVTIGRGAENTITLSSIVISRNHCEVKIQRDEVLITDLKSSNGIFVGTKKIPQSTPYVLQHLDIIGFGWTTGARLTEIQENEKFVFKLIKIADTPTVFSRIRFESENETLCDVEEKVSLLHHSNLERNRRESSKCIASTSGLQIKKEIIAEEHCNPILVLDDEVISILSDSDKEEETTVPGEKIKLQNISKENQSIKQNNDVVNVSHSVKQKERAWQTAPAAKKIKLESNEANQQIDHDDNIVYTLSDSENNKKCSYPAKPATKIKFEASVDEQNHPIQQDEIKQVYSNIQFEAFDIKQEYLAYDDEPIQIDSDSDTESENWILRLSQNSPGKPFTKISQNARFSNVKQEDCSYSQLDDYVSNEITDNEDNARDKTDSSFIIPSDTSSHDTNNHIEVTQTRSNTSKAILEQFTNVPISDNKSEPKQFLEPIHCKDKVDGFNTEGKIKQLDKVSTEVDAQKRTQMIHPLAQPQRRKSCTSVRTETKRNKCSKVQKETQAKRYISSFEKESRKKKLKEIADKEKSIENISSKMSSNSTNKSITNIKITSLNRGAFLTNVTQVVKPTKRKQNVQETQKNKVNEDKLPLTTKKVSDHENIDNNTAETAFNKKLDKSKKYDRINSARKSNKLSNVNAQGSIVPLKNVKPIADTDALNQTEKTILGKPFSKVVPLPPDKPNKKVRFSDAPPQVRVFVIEPGNNLNKTSLAKDFIRNQFSRFSLEKLNLMKILRWNPHWLEEQISRNDPPPILGSSVSAPAKLHVYDDQNYYQQCFGDLLLMEIWECLTVAYMKTKNQNNEIQFRIESMPPPPPDNCFDLFNISVNMSLPSSGIRSVPRVGDLLLVTFGLETARNHRFLYVNSVSCLPSPHTNKNSFYSISLQATFTEKMRLLRAGEVITGKNLVYINKELKFFEAMEYLNGSPLSGIILSPKPQHFPKIDRKPLLENNSQWTITLNSSQKIAVNASISAALNDQPSINMIQGPPGTGKSSVICAIIMSYFYDGQNIKQQNRGKILICATSNAAVDELVIRLLNIRQNLPKAGRFRMVRVGRAESMHPLALNVSSHQLALRDARSQQQSHAHRPALTEEISRLEAKMNMWKTAAQDAKDPVRVAYCQTRVTDISNRIAQVRGNLDGNAGSGGVLRPDQLMQGERRIIEGADIIVTTLSSAQNYKMKVLKERIALCIIDEAGQAIEPETLIPLTLGVKRLTLIGDPQQLPGFLCSQRAKKLGLGESLFARLMSCTEKWADDNNPVIMLQQQYRMHRDIVDYPNRAFYGSNIQTVAAPRPKLTIPPYTVVNIPSGDKGQGSCGANEIEAWGVARLVFAVNEQVTALKLSLAVITPYNAHKDLIKKNLKIIDPRLVSIEVNTVDSFQGQERDVVVVSLARSQGVGFLTEAGRMNVMLTRARHALIICLNPTAMMRNVQWRTLINDAQKRNVYTVLPISVCQPFTNRCASNDILKFLQVQTK